MNDFMFTFDFQFALVAGLDIVATAAGVTSAILMPRENKSLVLSLLLTTMARPRVFSSSFAVKNQRLATIRSLPGARASARLKCTPIDCTCSIEWLE